MNRRRDSLQMQARNPKPDVAVRKYGEAKKKKKKARGIEGRDVQAAYFAKELDKPQKHPLEVAWNNLLAKLPDQLQRNIRNTCRLL